jgi:phage terminase large subunit-like protein
LTAQEKDEIAALTADETPEAPDPVDWITQQFWIPELRGPIALAPYQKRCLREALARDDGEFRYSVIVWSDIKKSAKSCLAAAVMQWMNATRPWSECVAVANDLKQADSRVAKYYRRSLDLNEALGARTKISRGTVTWDNGATFEPVPIDPKGEAGGNAEIVCFSEMWGAHSKAQQLMWSEMTLSPLKYGQSFRWVETYAGHSGESPTLESLYTQGVKEGHRLWDDLPVWVNGRLFVLWNEEPRLPWQTPEYYAQEAAALTPNEFQRLHRNQWVSSEDVFVPAAWWEACKGEMPPVDANEPAVGALDASVSGDCFGIVVVARHPDDANRVVVRYARKWTPPKGGKFESYAEQEAEIRRLSDNFNIVEWAYDEYQLFDLCARLSREGIGWFNEFKQGQDRLRADKQLQDLIRDRRILHGGDPDLAEHVQNANAKAEGEKVRIIKRSENHKVDLAVCLSMATHENLRLNLA